MRVPEIGAPSVGLSSSPTPEQHVTGTPEELGGGLAQGIGKVGEAGLGAGQDLAQTALRFQEFANAASGDELNSKFINGMVALGHGDNGFYNKQGKDAVDAFPQFQQDLNSMREELATTAPNPVVRQQFDQDSRRMYGYQMLDAAQHRDQQQLKWFDSAANGAIQSSYNDAVTNYRDPVKLQAAEANIIQKQAEIDHRNGVDPGDTANVQAKVSTLYKDVITRTFDSDPYAAQNLFYTNSSKMTAADQDAVAKMLKGPLKNVEYDGIAHGIVSGAERAPKGDIGSWYQNGIIKTENTKSGVTSSEGAMGIGQITEGAGRQAAAELGIAYDKDRLLHDDAYNTQLGQQYFNDQLSRFNGNPAMAAAAYNWGAERVAALAAKAGNPGLGQISTQAFIDALPDGHKADGTYVPKDNVRKYVTDFMGRIGGVSPGIVATSGDVRDHMEDWLAEGRDAAQRLYSDPNEQAAAELSIDGAIRKYVDLIHSGQEDKERGASQFVMDKVFDPQGNQVVHSMTDLFKIPGVAENWTNMTTEQREKARNTILKPPAWTDQSAQKYQELRAEAELNPQKFVKEDIVNSGVPASTFRSLLNLQNEKKNKPPNDRIVQMMRVAEQFGAPSKGYDSDGTANKQFAGALMDEANVFSAVHGRLPNDNDVRDLTQKLLLQKSTGFFSSTHVYDEYTPFADRILEVPPDAIRGIANAIQKQGGTVSPGAIVYWWDRRPRAER